MPLHSAACFTLLLVNLWPSPQYCYANSQWPFTKRCDWDSNDDGDGTDGWWRWWRRWFIPQSTKQSKHPTVMSQGAQCKCQKDSIRRERVPTNFISFTYHLDLLRKMCALSLNILAFFPHSPQPIHTLLQDFQIQPKSNFMFEWSALINFVRRCRPGRNVHFVSIH